MRNWREDFCLESQAAPEASALVPRWEQEGTAGKVQWSSPSGAAKGATLLVPRAGKGIGRGMHCEPVRPSLAAGHSHTP
jgi:hypothetical protein